MRCQNEFLTSQISVNFSSKQTCQNKSKKSLFARQFAKSEQKDFGIIAGAQWETRYSHVDDEDDLVEDGK